MACSRVDLVKAERGGAALNTGRIGKLHGWPREFAARSNSVTNSTVKVRRGYSYRLR